MLVALAQIDGIPVKMSDGKVKKLPPPATELLMPAATEEATRRKPCERITARAILAAGW